MPQFIMLTRISAQSLCAFPRSCAAMGMHTPRYGPPWRGPSSIRMCLNMMFSRLNARLQPSRPLRRLVDASQRRRLTQGYLRGMHYALDA